MAIKRWGMRTPMLWGAVIGLMFASVEHVPMILRGGEYALYAAGGLVGGIVAGALTVGVTVGVRNLILRAR